MREMLRDLNRMLQERAEGGEPDFEAFKQKWGEHFPGVENLDQLMEQMRPQQAGQMQSLLRACRPVSAASSQDMMQSLFMQDERLEARAAPARHEPRASSCRSPRRPALHVPRRRRRSRCKQAMELMDELQQMDELERQIQKVRDPERPREDRPAAGRAAPGRGGGPATSSGCSEMTKKLEEAGYLERKGDQLELTARAIRKIGDKALRDIFAHLKRDRFGGHAHRAARRGRRPHRRDQALRVRRPVPARSARRP